MIAFDINCIIGKWPSWICVAFNTNSNINLIKVPGVEKKNIDKVHYMKLYSLTSGDIGKLTLDGGHFEIKYGFHMIKPCQ